MLKIAFSQFLGHIQAQNTWAQGILQAHAGELIQCKVSFLSQNFVILETGELAIAGETQSPETVISLSGPTLLRLIAKDTTAQSDINITGNTALATDVAKVLNHIEWDVTDDLSRVIGAAPAETISQFTKTSASTIKSTGVNAASMAAEYLQEEAMVIAKQRHIESFNLAVDDLRADVDRFEKRINQLQQSIQSKQTQMEQS